MSAAWLRAKLLGVRALSTILLSLSLAATAHGQVFGFPAPSYDNALWITAGSGDTRAIRMSDNASNGSWALERAKPVGITLDWGRRDRSLGIAVSRTQYAMQFSGAACPSCAGDVQALQALGTYRRAGSVFGGGLMQVVEFAVGATQWSQLKGRDGRTLPSMSPNTDFTYGASIGLSYPVGDRLELSAVYKTVQIRHETLRQVSTGAAPNNFINTSTLWYVARLRLGR